MPTRKQNYKATEKIALSSVVQLEVHDHDDGFAFRLVNTETKVKGEWVRYGEPASLPNAATMYPSGHYIYWMHGHAPIGFDDECLYYIHKVTA